MQNFIILDKSTIQLPSGIFGGVDSFSCYPGGELLGIRLSEKNILITHAGELVPAYTETHRRKNKYSVEFYQSGKVKAIALDEVQEIITPIGDLPAELVTFFESGELMRFFPLDGKISGMWSEQDEKTLAVPLSFELPFTTFTAILNGIAFYKTGDIRSITLFPGEVITVMTAFNGIKVRNGFSLYETGELESTEPALPVMVDTPIGKITAYDPDAIGITADSNSLVFDKKGRVISLITAYNSITAKTDGDKQLVFSPREVINPLDGESMITRGLIISFDYEADTVTFDNGIEADTLPVSQSGFTIGEYRACAP